MFKPMAITVALALGGALAFSLTAFPALAATAAAAREHAHDGQHGLFGRARRGYDRLLERRAATAAADAGGRGAGAGRRGRLRAARWAPSSSRASTRASCRSTSSGCRRSRSPRRSAWASRSRRCWRASPRCTSVVTRTGRAEVATDPVGPDETEVMVKLAPQGGVDDGARSRRPRARRSRRRSRARCRRRSCRCRSRSRIASTSCWPARAPTSSSRCSATISPCSSRPPTRSARWSRRPGPGRLARAARARPAAARGHARSPAPGPLRHERGSRARGGRGVAGRALRGQDLRGLAPLRSDAAAAAGDADARRRSASCWSARRPGTWSRWRRSRPSARPKGRRSSTASRCSGACWSRSTCAGAIWSASSTRRATRSRAP